MRDIEKQNIYTNYDKQLIRPFHIELLASELFRRKKRNPRYSLRAFAHALGIDPGALSRILAGKKQISLAITRKIIRVLQLTPEEKEVFLISVAQEKKDKATAILSHEFLHVKEDGAFGEWPLKTSLLRNNDKMWELKLELNNQAHIDQTLETLRKCLLEAAIPPLSTPNAIQKECKLIVQLRPIPAFATCPASQSLAPQPLAVVE